MGTDQDRDHTTFLGLTSTEATLHLLGLTHTEATSPLLAVTSAKAFLLH